MKVVVVNGNGEMFVVEYSTEIVNLLTHLKRTPRLEDMGPAALRLIPRNGNLNLSQ
jgi:hypothetical protein